MIKVLYKLIICGIMYNIQYIKLRGGCYMCKTHAMKVSYLLGVEESVLIRDYHDDYIDSEIC